MAIFTPFVFSAFSETSLITILERFHQHLENNSDSVNLRDLAYTLHSRRTGFQITTAIAASSVEDLSRKIARITNAQEDDNTPVISRIPRRKDLHFGRPRFLGVFVSESPSELGLNKYCCY